MAQPNGEGTPVQVRPLHDTDVFRSGILVLVLILEISFKVIFSSLLMSLPPSERRVLFLRSDGPSLALPRSHPWALVTPKQHTPLARLDRVL